MGDSLQRGVSGLRVGTMRIETYPLWPGGRAPDLVQCAESARAQVIAAHGAQAMENDEELGEIVRFAAALCDTPIALVSIVEEHRQHFIARKGMEQRETPRSLSFCAHAMLGAEIFVIEDAAQDPRFADNALVTGPEHIRFYAGAPLVSGEGIPLGALCIIDSRPRPGGLTALQEQGLRTLARAVMRRLTSERDTLNAEEALDHADRRLIALAEHIPVYAWATDRQGNLEFANSALYEYAGTRDLGQLGIRTIIHPDDVKELLTRRKEGMARATRWEARVRVKGADGVYRWMLLRVWPLRTDNAAEPETWFGAGVDVDDLHRLSESRDLLARELSHRIKNIFAVIGGLIAVRARGRPESPISPGTCPIRYARSGGRMIMSVRWAAARATACAACLPICSLPMPSVRMTGSRYRARMRRWGPIRRLRWRWCSTNWQPMPRNMAPSPMLRAGFLSR